MIPKEWQLEPHYQSSLLWFSREPRTHQFMGQEIPPRESVDYPGWYFLQRGDALRIVDTLEEALAELKSRLKHWNLSDIFGRPAPYQASKSERKQMLIELLEAPITTPPPNHNPDYDEPLPPLLERKWELGQYLLVATIEYTRFRPEFFTHFDAANNPIRSLVGKVCTLQAATHADLEREDEDEDFEAEWKELAVGTVHLEDNRLTVGFWSHTFEAHTLVYGVAYEEASFEDEELIYYLSSEAKE
ncbi:hypothetical protein [Meiothermus hypogaeus]|uniref:Uncharacterized protein n=2 Tax=Meiothermus hypogaeus TaxID=884155 RepID=A0A511R5A8_9DEIN|nr:hypothetical protein [Meiothermus hypogaeus]RIH74939.1 hypothetical protein Mhypo_03126 [Meiothermus hypogaeus]GEM84799.1 hypothetical protein MHY01S_29650 [Meiothermus hypogaeus NBRC 106114]